MRRRLERLLESEIEFYDRAVQLFDLGRTNELQILGLKVATPSLVVILAAGTTESCAIGGP